LRRRSIFWVIKNDFRGKRDEEYLGEEMGFTRRKIPGFFIEKENS